MTKEQDGRIEVGANVGRKGTRKVRKNKERKDQRTKAMTEEEERKLG